MKSCRIVLIEAFIALIACASSSLLPSSGYDQTNIPVVGPLQATDVCRQQVSDQPTGNPYQKTNKNDKFVSQTIKALQDEGNKPLLKRSYTVAQSSLSSVNACTTSTGTIQQLRTLVLQARQEVQGQLGTYKEADQQSLKHELTTLDSMHKTLNGMHGAATV